MTPGNRLTWPLPGTLARIDANAVRLLETWLIGRRRTALHLLSLLHPDARPAILASMIIEAHRRPGIDLGRFLTDIQAGLSYGLGGMQVPDVEAKAVPSRFPTEALP